jgi:hypothetical protein
MKYPFKNIGHARYSTNCTCPVFDIKKILSVPQTENMLQEVYFQ